MSIELKEWDVVDYLDSPDAMARYLDAAFEDGDAALIRAARGDVCRALGMTDMAEKAGIGVLDIGPRGGIYD